MLCQKILWIAMLIMAVVLIGAGVAGNAMAKADIGRHAAQFSGREIDDSLIKEAQEAENQDDYMVFLNFITYCMGNAEHGVVDAQQVYSAREQLNEGQMTQACLSDAEKEYWRKKEAEITKPFTYYFEEGYAGIYSYIYVANFFVRDCRLRGVCR